MPGPITDTAAEPAALTEEAAPTDQSAPATAEGVAPTTVPAEPTTAAVGGNTMLPAIGPDPTGKYQDVGQQVVGPYVVRTWSEPGAFRQPEWPIQDVVTIGKGDTTLVQIPSALVAAETNTDVTGTGSPDIVVHVVTGGNACCQQTVVYDTEPELRAVLATPLDAYCGKGLHGSLSDLDGDGASEFVGCAAGDYDLDGCFYFWKMESSKPKSILAYDAAQGAYVPASPRFPGEYLADLDGARALATPVTAPDQSACGVGNLALTYLFAGRTEEAWSTLRMMGGTKAADLERMIAKALQADPMYVAPGETGKPVVVEEGQ